MATAIVFFLGFQLAVNMVNQNDTGWCFRVAKFAKFAREVQRYTSINIASTGFVDAGPGIPGVPDNGSTLVLLGIALAGLGCASRKFKVRPAVDSAHK